MKLAIIGGAGLLGSTAAFCLGIRNSFEEIKLIDIKENVLQSHVMDMDQGISILSDTRVVRAGYEDLEDCDVIMITASVPETGSASRDAYLDANRSILVGICKRLRGLSSNKVIINAVNPVDVLNSVIQEHTGIDRRRILGFCINDTTRLRWSVAKLLGIAAHRVEAWCLGEHGGMMVPLLDQVKADGMPVQLSDAQKEQVLEEIDGWFTAYQGLKSGRTSGWTSGIGLAALASAVAENKGEVLPCSIILDGEYHNSAVSLGVLVRIGANGVSEFLEPALSDQEQAALDAAAVKIKRMYQTIGP